MEARATELGLATILCNTAGSAVREAAYVHMLLERRVDGMIFISCEAADLHADHSHYGRLLAEGARLVFVNGALPSLEAPSVGVDERAAGRLAATHLLELGHRRIGLVAGPEHFLPTAEKRAGLEEALHAAGLDGATRAAYTEFGVEGGRLALRALLARRDRPSAVICSSDLMAIGVLQEAGAAGLSVPGDLSVVGFDDIEVAAYVGLTTVRQPLEASGARGAELLLDALGGADLAGLSETLPLELVVRATTAPPRARRA
jgi:DNA-binding LacI/PurR family transcriptional regulator